MNIILSDRAFVLVGRHKLRVDDIVDVARHPAYRSPSSATGDRPERVAIVTRDGNSIVVPADEPHFAQAVALYEAIDAVDLAGAKPDGPWTPGDIVNLFRGFEPDCGLTISSLISPGRAEWVKVIAAREGRVERDVMSWTICLCGDPLCGDSAADIPSYVEKIKADITRRFGMPGPGFPPVGRAAQSSPV